MLSKPTSTCIEGRLDDGTLVVRALGPIVGNELLSEAEVAIKLVKNNTKKGITCREVPYTSEEDMPFRVFSEDPRVKKWIGENKRVVRGNVASKCLEGKLENGTLVVRASCPASADALLKEKGVLARLSYKQLYKGITSRQVEMTNEEDMPFRVFSDDPDVKKWVEENQRGLKVGKRQPRTICIEARLSDNTLVVRASKCTDGNDLLREKRIVVQFVKNKTTKGITCREVPYTGKEDMPFGVFTQHPGVEEWIAKNQMKRGENMCMEGTLENGTLVVRASGTGSGDDLLSEAGVSIRLSCQRTNRGITCRMVVHTNIEDMPFGVFTGNARVKNWIEENQRGGWE